jgi:hypothetical protein
VTVVCTLCRWHLLSRQPGKLECSRGSALIGGRLVPLIIGNTVAERFKLLTCHGRSRVVMLWICSGMCWPTGGSLQPWPCSCIAEQSEFAAMQCNHSLRVSQSSTLMTSEHELLLFDILTLTEPFCQRLTT